MARAMQTIYSARIRSERETVWDIHVKSSLAGALDKRRDVALLREGAAVIEWGEVGKLDPVAGSSLTLTLLSESDREFLWLWQVEVGTVRCDVYRNGSLYWSGVLDTELYEEPYTWVSDYEVAVTFSDLAVLDRLKWSGEGLWSVRGIIDHCISESGVNVSGLQLQHSLCSYSSGSGDTPIDLSTLHVNAANFYDEDGEAMTLREVLEAVLQPLALRITQKAGRLWLQDLHTLATTVPTQQVEWLADDGVLGVDKVYNNMKVTFSPYGDAKLIDGNVDHDDVLKGHSSGTMIKTGNNWAEAADGFTICYGDQDGLGLTLQNGAKWYRIDSVWSGSDEAGILWAYRGGSSAYSYNQLHCNDSMPRAMQNGQCVAVPIITSGRVWVGQGNNIYHQLKVTLSVLADVRYNPFESEANENEEGNWQRLKDWVNFAYVPVMLRLRDANGNVLYHYENNGVQDGNGWEHTAQNSGWVAGDGTWGCMWLCYYDQEDRKSASGLGGWKKNRPIIGYYRGGLPKRFTAMGEGEYIKLPPVAGWLELEVGRGLYQFDYKREEKDIYSRLRWLMYKAPTIEIVKADGTKTEQNDVEDSAWLLRAAQETLEIDTSVGTTGTRRFLPNCKGVLLDSNASPVRTLGRAGVNDRVERLLIGTAYSQYGSRHQTLGGSVRLLHEMRALTDATSAGRYMVLSEVQTLVEDKSEVLLCEVSEDNYEGIEWETN